MKGNGIFGKLIRKMLLALDQLSLPWVKVILMVTFHDVLCLSIPRFEAKFKEKSVIPFQ